MALPKFLDREREAEYITHFPQSTAVRKVGSADVGRAEDSFLVSIF
jgi:hypothetical protein